MYYADTTQCILEEELESEIVHMIVQQLVWETVGIQRRLRKLDDDAGGFMVN